MLPRFCVALLAVAAGAKCATTAASLDPNSRALLLSALEWGDRNWDEPAGLMRSLDSRGGGDPPRHLVRETSWYALGLLQRGGGGDRERAIRALNGVLDKQFHEPGKRWDGTFYRAPEEQHPTATAEMWNDYDPNWREFIGTTFAIILLDWREKLPPQLAKRMEDSIQSAIEGEMHEGRLKPGYTNIALMYGFLWNHAATHWNHKEWIRPSEDWIAAVNRGFREYNAFEEFNSPTYYGVDLYGLALWRVHGSSQEIRDMGAGIEATLWRSIASSYHAGLKNIAGPYDRSYGMDMRRYLSLTGLWMRTVLPSDAAPFPVLKEPLEHANDLMFAPCAVSLGTKIPADAMKNFREFLGERLVRQEIPGHRVATAWLGTTVMLGGEFTGMTRDAGTYRSQFHPATVHWKTPDGDVGWIRLVQCPREDASADRNMLTIMTAAGDSRFRISVAGLQATKITLDHWTLPGLSVKIETDARGGDVSPGDQYVEVVYRGATRFLLKTTPASAR
jgi:hypothetical protein